MRRLERPQRRHVRRKISADGTVLFANGTKFACKVQDISETGAMLIMAGEEEVPREFLLEIGSLGSVRRRCERVRQDGKRVGVKFPDRSGRLP